MEVIRQARRPFQSAFAAGIAEAWALSAEGLDYLAEDGLDID